MSLTNHPNIIKELCEYFIRFPNRDIVLNRFRKRPSEAYQSAYYTELRDYLTNLADGDHSLCPGIDDFVFAATGLEYVKKQIEDMDGKVFLMLDYGNISGTESGAQKTNTDLFELAITVAKQYKPDDLDAFEHAALSDQMLNNVRCIRAKLLEDDASCSGTRDEITYPHIIIPFYARDLQNSIGWTLTFTQRTIDLL